MKAVFIIDVDKDELGKAVATITAEENDISFFARGVIRPLPQEREFGKQNIMPIKVDGNSFVLGWNACLEEIQNGKNSL